jgi:hypothetical protein
MTFLELCQRVRQECGISGTGPLTVLNQSGEMKRIVDWVNQSWKDLQIKRTNWLWMRGAFTVNTVSGTGEYTKADAGIAARFLQWDRLSFSIYKTASGLSDEVPLPYMDYILFRSAYLTGTRLTGKPYCFTLSPSGQVLLAPIPNDIYTVTGEYFKTPQPLAADADQPEMPETYHDAIVYRAMMKYARYEAAGEIYADAEKDYKRIIYQLELNQLPTIGAAETLE